MTDAAHCICLLSFFFNDTATTEIYTLSLHDALPISPPCSRGAGWTRSCWTRSDSSDLLSGVGRRGRWAGAQQLVDVAPDLVDGDRKSTRLNSSHANISYAVFCLKKKNNSSTPGCLTS